MRPDTDTPLRHSPESVDLSVIVPMYREASRIVATLADLVPALRLGPRSSEVILVDDGSDDETVPAVSPWITDEPSGALQRVLLIGFERNWGKGAAVREGLRTATGRWCLIMDADNSCRITEVEKLLREAAGTGAALIAGSRNAAGARVEARLTRRAFGRLFHVANRMIGIGLLQDTQCGFKLYRDDLVAAILPHARENRYLFDLEHLMLARALRFGITEVGVEWAHRDGGQVHPLRDGARMLLGAIALRRRFDNWQESRPDAQALPEIRVNRVRLKNTEAGASELHANGPSP